MFKTSFKKILLGLMLVISQPVFALSLGGIEVKSTFAQPFLAEIKIPSYTSDEIETIKINLASNTLFKEQGVEMLPILRKFRFSVEDKKDGTLYIKVHTKTAVKELFISFLLEVTWRGGRIIKNYDVLLTPEAITQVRARKPPETIAKRDNTATEQTKEKTQQITQSTSSNADRKKNVPKNKLRNTKNGGFVYSPVSSGESLSYIAKKIRSGKDMSRNQVMIALFNENLHAFTNNDINRLKIGATLKINDSQNITKISKQKATKLANQYIKGPIKTDTKPTAIAEIPPTEIKTETLAESNNRLVISSANEEPIPLEIMKQIQAEELAEDEHKIKMANMKVQELIAENKALKKRINEMEKNRDAEIERLFLATIQQETVKSGPESNSLTQQDKNLLVASTALGMEGNEKLSIMDHIENYQTAISVSGVALLSMTLIGMRKKEEILDIVHDFKSRFNND